MKPDIFRGATPGFGSLALILILFEGGLDLKLGEILKHFGPGFVLSIFSYVLTIAAVAGVLHFAMHFPWLDALLMRRDPLGASAVPFSCLSCNR